MKFIAIIPARYASTRFPGKPLARLCGMTVIERVYRQTRKALDTVYVATDDERIYREAENFGGKVIMTRSDHRSGTDRIEEAIEKMGGDGEDLVVINVQGDEPFIHPEQIKSLCRQFDDASTQIATLGKPFTTAEELKNPNSPKIIVNRRGFAVYFSRSVIPFVKGLDRDQWIKAYPYLKHIGIYAYRREVLREITQLPQSALEKAEGLEQLRWIDNGYPVRVAITNAESVGIDTPADLQRAEQMLKKISNSLSDK